MLSPGAKYGPRWLGGRGEQHTLLISTDHGGCMISGDKLLSPKELCEEHDRRGFVLVTHLKGARVTTPTHVLLALIRYTTTSTCLTIRFIARWLRQTTSWSVSYQSGNSWTGSTEQSTDPMEHTHSSTGEQRLRRFPRDALDLVMFHGVLRPWKGA